MLKILFVLLLPCIVFAQNEIQFVQQNNEAIDLLTKTKDASSSLFKFEELVGQYPDNLVAKLNLASNYVVLEDYENAEKIYLEILDLTKDSPQFKDIQFISCFNMAGIQIVKKQQKEALAYYQCALNVEPTDKASKINIEIIVQNITNSQDSQNGESDDQEKKDQDQGEDENQKDQKDNKDQKDQNKPDQNDKEKKTDSGEQKQKPKFKENELSKQDVKRIFQELKRQEEGIRAKENQRNPKEPSNGKDW
ncbi:MAG: hypothetical protein AB8E15_12340 [Bdellovibrionales bacterium]